MRSDFPNGTAATLPADGPTEGVTDAPAAIAPEQVEALGRIVRLTARSAAAPFAFLSVGASEGQRIVAAHGLPDDVADPVSGSIVAEADDVLVVGDAAKDERVAEHPMVTGEPGIGALAGIALRDASGEVVGVLGVAWSKPHHPSEQALDSLRDAAALAAPTVAATQHPEADRDRRLRSLELLLAHTNDVVVVVDTAGRITAASPSLESVLGFPADLDLPEGAVGLVHPEDRALARRGLAAALADGDDVFHVRVLTSTGSFRNMDCTVVDHFDKPEIRGAVVTMRDVSERHMLNQMLTFQRTHDRLTELPNLAQFQEHLRPALSRATRQRASVAVCVLDIDGFADLNRDLGHDAGDELLVEVAKRIRSTVRTGDTVSRISGDEFAVLLDPVADLAEATAVAQRILDAVAGPHSLRAGVADCTARCGIALSDDQDDVSTIITRAVDARRGIAPGSIGGGWSPAPAPTPVDEPMSDPTVAPADAFTNAAFSSDAFTDAGFAGEAFTDAGLSSDAFTDSGFSGDAFADTGFSDEAFTDAGFSDEAFTDEPPVSWGRRVTDLFPPDDDSDLADELTDSRTDTDPHAEAHGSGGFTPGAADGWFGDEDESAFRGPVAHEDDDLPGAVDVDPSAPVATSWFDDEASDADGSSSFGIVFDERF